MQVILGGGESTQSSSLRPLVESINRQIASIVGGTPADETGLFSSWAELVALLGLGPAPDMRQCPACGKNGMRAATICGFCWTKLAPLPSR